VRASAVLGCGRHLPARRVTNDALAAVLDVSPEAIVQRTGVAVRHQAEEGDGPSDLAREAASAALADAGLAPADVDLIVFATMTPDIAFPGSGCFLQDKLGCGTIGALDVRAQCAGFLFAVATADRFVRARAATRVLVAGADIHTTALDWSPRAADVTPRFGDGAGALVLGAAEEPGVVAVALHSDPDRLERFWCEFPASRNFPTRMNREAFEAGRHFYQLDADALHADAEAALVDVTHEALDRARVAADRVALFVVHYLDPRVARRAADRARLPADRVVAPAETIAHVASAGIPVALADARAAGRIRPGDLVCCAAFGAGMSWGAALLRM
jgi:3-oxoacyl-[acyl-carrier-protein] synthase-3